MIIIDTNIISELMRQVPTPSVVNWLNKQLPESIYTTSISIFEVQFGIDILQEGRR